MIYPNSTPEFRILVKQDEKQELQVRYHNQSQGYTSKWQAIKVEYETIDSYATT
jgi:hypothetical protein